VNPDCVLVVPACPPCPSGVICSQCYPAPICSDRAP
jgi:hypothetical protein